MAEYLTRTVYGPDGDIARRGAQPPDGWDGGFLDDLRARGALISDADHPLLALPVGTADEVEAAWARTTSHDLDDVGAATAAERVRSAARAVGRLDIARGTGSARTTLSGAAERRREGGTQ